MPLFEFIQKNIWPKKGWPRKDCPEKDGPKMNAIKSLLEMLAQKVGHKKLARKAN